MILLELLCSRYRVFLGHKQYFVSSDVGGGKMQWYAFYNEPAGGADDANGMLLYVYEIWLLISTHSVNVKFSIVNFICGKAENKVESDAHGIIISAFKGTYFENI